MKISRIIPLAAFAMISALAFTAASQTIDTQERIAALKANLVKSKELLRQYEWIEVTVLSLKGEEKSRTEFRCYWGADGKLQRVPVGATPSTDKKRGLRGKLAADKAKDIQEYMKSAVEMIRSYVPPDPARLQACKDAGKLSLTPAGSRLRLDFKDYQKPGDVLGIEVDLAKNTLLTLSVASWLKEAKDTVTMTAGFGTLNDGATYVSEVAFAAPSQSLEVKMTNSGYKKM